MNPRTVQQPGALPPAPPVALLPASEVAARLGVSANTVRTLIKRRQLLAIAVGEQWRVEPAELDAYIERNRTQPAATSPIERHGLVTVRQQRHLESA